MNGMKIGHLNMGGWGMKKLDNMGIELEEWKLDQVGVTETHLIPHKG